MPVGASLLLLATAVSPPNLLLVTIDTLRADRVGAYGCRSVETPAMDRLAREGVLVEDATVQAPQTRPSHVSIFTGLLPHEHGIRDNHSAPLRGDLPTLATILHASGYDTAAFIGAYPVSADSGLDRGFAHFDDPFAGGRHVSIRDGRVERTAGEVVDSTLAWLGQPRALPFLAWVHLFDPHHPYQPPPPFDQRYARNAYDGEVAYSDSQLGRLLEFLDERRLAERTLVVVTSDHGEGLGDHGEDEHSVFLYDSTLRVPLLLRWPSALPAGARIPGQFRSVDLLPTLLELLGLPGAPTSGRSHARQLRAGAALPGSESYAESLFGSLRYGWAPLRALRAEGWKYVDAPRPELYSLAEDPGELHDLVDSRRDVADRMRELLRHIDGGQAEAVELPPDAGVMERLMALGYAAGAASTAESGARADPKDTIREYQAFQREMHEALRLYRAGDVDRALPILSRLSRSATLTFDVEYYLGRSLLEKGRHAEAIEALGKALSLVPRFVPTYAYLARAHVALDRLQEARTVLEDGLRVAPENPELLGEKADVLVRQGDLNAARACLETARSRDPKSGHFRVMLSTVYRAQGDVTKALVEAREAVRLDPGFAEGWSTLGLLLGASGQDVEAASALRQALELDADHPDALFYLGAIEIRAGRTEKAVPLLARLVRAAPDYPQAKEFLDAAQEALAATVVHLRILLVQDRARADEIAGQLAEGQDFAALARAFSVHPTASEGGDLGLLRIADLSQGLRVVAATLSPRALSPVFKTSEGYALLLRED